jgi:uncharacterized protein (TIGR04255 family)
MATPRYLTRAPISEALIDFRVAPRPDLDANAFRSAASTLAASFPEVQERRDSEAMLQLVGGGQVAANMKDLGLQGLLFKSGDGRRIVQFRRDGFTLNHLNPYHGWDEMYNQAFALWNTYCEIAQPLWVTRVAVRYINRIPLPGQEVDLDKYINTGPRFPEGVPDDYSAWQSRIVIEDHQDKLSAIVTQSLEQKSLADPVILILDIDAFKTAGAACKATELGVQLSSLRLLKNRIFFGSLKDDFAKEFE